VEKERPLVAAVIYNRLSKGEPLGIDATTRYEYNEWEKAITQDQLDKDTPYNTRLNVGLPPTPIGNPGLAAIKAAANPAKVDYLFYVVKPGTCPAQHTFTNSEAEFDKLVAEYNNARADAGNESPTC
jgi:cell division protein YceG involved in septum cleavage